MLRRSLIVCVLALLVGCQDYNFNPVGKCVIQPGSSRIRVANLSTADILFVVDDSGSMQSKQQRLADNFSAFIDQLALTQKDRASKHLEALDFHIAVTTSSVFEGHQASALCRAPTTGGQLTCNIQNPAFSWRDAYSFQCTQQDAPCADLVESYAFPRDNDVVQCIPGLAVEKTPYPAGNFVAAGANPKVLHFTKDLDWVSWKTANVDPRLDALVAQFRQNINVGTCGSGMEQHFEAGRLALQKALHQNGLSQPDITPSDWPHPGAKLVVVFVGDEDDCSNPKDPNSALFISGGPDVCTAPATEGRRLPVSDYVNYFAGIGRPFSAAFIYSADPSSCHVDAEDNIVCTPAQCSCTCPASNSTCDIPAQCGGFSAGTRFTAVSAGLREKGFSTVEGSVCDADFASTLTNIAKLVKPPAQLKLPSLPAASEVAVLRLETADGKSSRPCTGPALTRDERAASDWWFFDGDAARNCAGDSSSPSSKPTSCIFINHDTGKCEPNPGETYIAQYLGVVPAGGCADVSDCTRALLGKDADWTCAKPTPDAARGTCICNPGT